jgi:hypothetical protein
MYLQKVISKKTIIVFFVSVLKVTDKKGQDTELDTDPLVSGTDPSRIRSIGSKSTPNNLLTKRAGYRAGSGPVNQWYGSLGPDPYQNVTDPEH